MKKGRKINEESRKVLSLLLEKGAMSIGEFTQIHFKGEMPWDHRSVFLKMHDLKRGGYVKGREKNNQSFFHLTPKGKMQILKYLHLEKLRIKKWDGHWRIVIFDLPESLKKWRNYLRAELKNNLGFWPLQESVYITPHPVIGELDELLKEWNLRKYFRYLTVSEIDREEELKLVFGLK
ncbi:MAG: hypothetical protein A2846_00125 [Candidatus Doudnabacteria bacterium RIFCSPHIGHO2_01_FULL_49_9]|uniref:Transcriptional repressor PaaX-like central Cas2-like domain-containing protein n=1 Tax=Candidatus Doudnabacteria bacterium RIFCSPHIGHO2_01_FULL_49_9 TaxID=1817827 RepID=A0A1F5P1L3_9BACT|nr:MAG: hypothetical protein A2846_00125 [Candidatus Doudnabacteria bacterium RIFCSPHIGHO2_01_FULL_49_9]